MGFRPFIIGHVWTSNLSLDIYQTKVNNRITLSRKLAATSPAVQACPAANGVSNSSGITYFTNAVDTRTSGADLVASHLSDFDNNGSLPYSVFSPFGFNGAYVYGKVAYRW